MPGCEQTSGRRATAKGIELVEAGARAIDIAVRELYFLSERSAPPSVADESSRARASQRRDNAALGFGELTTPGKHGALARSASALPGAVCKPDRDF